MTRFGFLVAVLALVGIVVAPGTARAHSDGKVELLVVDVLTTVSGGSTTLEFTVIDADSGDVQPGYSATVVAEGPGPTQNLRLADLGGGRYATTLDLAPGQWSLLIRVDPGPAAPPAISTTTHAVVDVAAGSAQVSDVEVAPVEFAAAPVDQVDVRVEVSRQYDQPTELYVPVMVYVSDPLTGELRTDIVHEVVVRPTNAVGGDGGLFTLAADVAGVGGTYRGIAILPHEGVWTLEVSVNDPAPLEGRDGVPAVVFGTGSLEVSVSGGILDSARGVYDPLRERVNDRSGAYVRGVIVFWLHSLASFGWVLAVTLLGLLGVPRSRRWFSEHSLTQLDIRFPTIQTATRWLLVVSVATGGVNIVSEMAYGLPLSGDELDRVSRLPYASPYLLAFAAKMAVFAGMVALSIGISRAARRARDDWPVAGEADHEVVASGVPAQTRLLAFAASTGLIVLAVTALKYTHLIIEAFRAR